MPARASTTAPATGRQRPDRAATGPATAHRPVRHRDRARPVGDEEDRRRRRGPRARWRPARPPRSPRRGPPWARRASRTGAAPDERPGHADPPPLAAGQAAPPLAEDAVRRAASPSPTRASAARTSASDASGAPAGRCRRRCRRTGTGPAAPRRPGAARRRRRGRDVGRGPVGGHARRPAPSTAPAARGRRQQRALAGPAGPVTRHDLARRAPQRDAGRGEQVAARLVRRTRPSTPSAAMPQAGTPVRAAGAPAAARRSPRTRAPAAATPSSLAWNSAPSWRSGRYASGARISTNSPTSQVSSPTASRRPTPTATSATESVASSSSASADRNAIRSVAMVVGAVGVGDPAQDRDLGLGPAEGAQRRQARDDVEEVVGQPGQRRPAPRPVRLRHLPDQDHEHRDQRQGQPRRSAPRRGRRRAGTRPRRPGRSPPAPAAAGTARSSRRARRGRASRAATSSPLRLVAPPSAGPSATARSRSADPQLRLDRAADRWAPTSWAQPSTARAPRTTARAASVAASASTSSAAQERPADRRRQQPGLGDCQQRGRPPRATTAARAATPVASRPDAGAPGRAHGWPWGRGRMVRPRRSPRGDRSTPLAEDPVGPALVDQDHGGEDHRHDRHDLERVRRGRGVGRREAEGRVRATTA